MTTQLSPLPSYWPVAKKQLTAICVFFLLVILISTVFYINDRQKEWRLRSEQATHQLELAFQLIDRDIQRVCSDVRLVAKLQAIRNFEQSDPGTRLNVEYELKNFLISKKTFHQIRLVDLNGQETVRVDWRNGNPGVIGMLELQNKKDRYYIRDSLQLNPDEIFVSEFDLNQEHGEIDQPLCPVIRFVSPVCDRAGNINYLLVANYMGAPLLAELASETLPGSLFLVRDDGHYLLGPGPEDAWGWLLNHSNSFDRQFEDAWQKRLESASSSFLNTDGLFAFKKLNMDQFADSESPASGESSSPGNTLFVASYLPRGEVFANSRRLLNRLFALFAIVLIPIFYLTRLWAYSAVKRRQQHRLIERSEIKLRELSSRLLRIQEEERKSISREIHDQLGQLATAINLDLKLAVNDALSEKVREQLNRAIHESEQLLESLHNFASRIRPVELDDLGLSDAIQSYMDNFESRTGIDCSFEFDLNDFELPAVVTENVFRLIQESLNNVLKHSSATRVNVLIRLIQNENGHHLKLQVKDDGAGVRRLKEPDSTYSNDNSSRLGILGMQERIDLMDGRFHWESHPETGTIVDVDIPIHRPEVSGRKEPS